MSGLEWRIPTDNDFKTLEKELGMTQVEADKISTNRGTTEGKKMKDSATWNGTNTSGFTGLPAGLRGQNANFYWIKDSGANVASYYWSSTESGVKAICRALFEANDGVGRIDNPQSWGFNVRLVRDWEGAGDSADNYVGNDGKTYNAVKIGNQVWTKKSLQETQYADGSSIPRVTNSVSWENDTDGARCEYDNDTNKGATYGFFYNYFAVVSAKGLVNTRPIFTNYTISNYDKTITVKDKYDNILIESSTSTLLGGDDAVIKGYSKVRAVITTANKMVARGGATESKYRLSTETKSKEEPYSSVSTVNIDLDNVLVKNFNVSAIDSNNFLTTVSKSITYLCNYSKVSIISAVLERDDGTEEEAKLIVSGTFFNEYFGGGEVGVENDITLEWRFKHNIEPWDEQEWEGITPDIDGNTFSFDDYVDGDLEGGGFDKEKGFDVEVRVYDKVSHDLVEHKSQKGIPLLHYHEDGLAINSVYDEAEGGDLQIQGNDIMNIIKEEILSIISDVTVIKSFTQDDTWEVPAGITEVDVLVVAGGGGGGRGRAITGGGGGGGGAGGLVYIEKYDISEKDSPIPITIGSGGVGNADGDDSVFGDLIAVGGGRGSPGGGTGNTDGNDGGSGGGGGRKHGSGTADGGSSIQTTTNDGYPNTGFGNDGGDGLKVPASGDNGAGGGGGGASSKGANATGVSGANGGNGWDLAGWGYDDGLYAVGGDGGDGQSNVIPSNSAVNTGNGGKGGSYSSTLGTGSDGGSGGSGIVIIRYKF